MKKSSSINDTFFEAMKTIFSILFFLVIGIAEVAAQKDIEPMNGGAANFLTLPANARILAMGGANTALTDGNAVFYNGAGLLFGNGNHHKTGIAYNYTPWMRDFEPGYNFHSLGGYHVVNNRNAVYGGIRYYDYPKLAVLHEGLPNYQHIYPSEWAFDLGYSRKILTNLALSATLRLIHSNMGNADDAKSANAVAFDLGVLYSDRLPFIKDAKWGAGMQLSNLGTKLEYLMRKDELPMTGKFGASAYLPINACHKITMAADLGYRLAPPDVQSLSVNSGVEYALFDLLMFRGGYRYGNKDKGDWSYATAGMGVSYWKLHFDFAWLFTESEAPINNSFSLSCGVRF